MVILATSIGGAYIAIRATAYWLGGWITLSQIMAQAKADTFYNIPNKWWLYFFAFVVLSIAGFFYQYSQKGKAKKDEKVDHRELTQVLKDNERF